MLTSLPVLFHHSITIVLITLGYMAFTPSSKITGKTPDTLRRKCASLQTSVWSIERVWVSAMVTPNLRELHNALKAFCKEPHPTKGSLDHTHRSDTSSSSTLLRKLRVYETPEGGEGCHKLEHKHVKSYGKPGKFALRSKRRTPDRRGRALLPRMEHGRGSWQLRTRCLAGQMYTRWFSSPTRPATLDPFCNSVFKKPFG